MNKTLFIIIVLISGTTLFGREIKFPLVEKGRTVPAIYYAHGQEFAAKELSYILKKMTGADFSVTPVEKRKKGPSFMIGRTPEAEKAGADFSKFAPDEWFVKMAGETIILAGGSNQGSLYAVYELMEKFAGVSFPAMDVEVIPRKDFLSIPHDLFVQGKPDFFHRTVYEGISGGDRKFQRSLRDKRMLFNIRNRESAIKGVLQYDVSRQYNTTHTLYSFVGPEYFKTNPEYFSMNEKGKRFLGKNKYVGSQLCMTNKDIVKITVESLKIYIKKDRAMFPEGNWPTIYKISQLDGTSYICLCPDCKALTKREGSESALLIHYLNQVAEEIGKSYPDVKIWTGFYVSTEEAPKKIRPHKNLICEWNDLYTRSDCYRPLTHKINTARRKQYEQWVSLTSSVAVWDYHNMGDFTIPPRLETVVDALAADIKYFHANGTRHYITEMEDGVVFYGASQLFLDLQYYVGKRLLIDVTADPEKLISHFMHHYYGPAEKSMTEILTRIRKAVKEEPNAMPAQTKVRSYQTNSFVRPILELWKNAVKQTAPGSVYRKHVEQDGLIIIGAALRCKGLVKGQERNELIAAYRKITADRIREFVGARQVKEAFNRVEEMIRDFELSQIGIKTPAEFKHIPEDRIHVYGWPHFRDHSHHRNKQPIHVDDPASSAKRAATPAARIHDQYEKYKPRSFGVYDYGTRKSMEKSIKQLPQDEKYHWHYIGRADIQPGSFFWAFRWFLQIPFVGVWQLSDGIKEGNKWHVYVSARFTGPAYVKGSTSPNKLYIDYVVLTRDKVKLNGK